MPDLAIQTLDPRMLSSLAQSSSALNRLKPAHTNQPNRPKADVDALLGEFQNVMFTEMMKAMRATVPESGLFDRNTGREIYESFLDEKYAAATGNSVGSLGLTEALRRQLGLDEAPELEPAVPTAVPAVLPIGTGGASCEKGETVGRGLPRRLRQVLSSDLAGQAPPYGFAQRPISQDAPADEPFLAVADSLPAPAVLVIPAVPESAPVAPNVEK